MTRVTIDQLTIRLKGVTPERARELARELGRTILARLAEHPNIRQVKRPIHIDKIDAGTVQPASPPNASSEVSRTVANRVVNTVTSHTA